MSNKVSNKLSNKLKTQRTKRTRQEKHSPFKLQKKKT